MIKFVMCLRQHPNMTQEQFQDYWTNKHGPFFMTNAGTMRAKKYVQSLTIDTPFNEGLRNSRACCQNMMASQRCGLNQKKISWRQ